MLMEIKTYRVITEASTLEVGVDLRPDELLYLVTTGACLIWEYRGISQVIPVNVLADALRQVQQRQELIQLGRGSEVPKAPVRFYCG
jgi:hypothetical protein